MGPSVVLGADFLFQHSNQTARIPPLIHVGRLFSPLSAELLQSEDYNWSHFFFFHLALVCCVDHCYDCSGEMKEKHLIAETSASVIVSASALAGEI
jgi:hypothetical protein